jgi:flagellar protein FliO/FliZ
VNLGVVLTPLIWARRQTRCSRREGGSCQLLLAAIAAAGAVMVKAHLSGETASSVFFKSRADPRLSVLEYASVDSKRKLVLIRRDDVEHLIMTGGPVDVVIETGIGEPPKRAADVLATNSSAATVFTRPPRGFGQAAGPTASPSDESETALRR